MLQGRRRACASVSASCSVEGGVTRLTQDLSARQGRQFPAESFRAAMTNHASLGASTQVWRLMSTIQVLQDGLPPKALEENLSFPLLVSSDS